MTCKGCHSANRREFTAEINIHFPGRKGINIPTVWVFPEMSVCMDCGFAGFAVPDAELKQLDSSDLAQWRRRDIPSMMEFHEEESSESCDLANKIKLLLQHQRYAVRRANSIGMSRDEASEMEARINEIEELVDRLSAS